MRSMSGVLDPGVVTYLQMDVVPWGGGLYIWNLTQEDNIWVNYAGVDPVVMGDGSTFVVETFRRYTSGFMAIPGQPGLIDVRLISDSAVTFSVEVNE